MVTVGKSGFSVSLTVEEAAFYASTGRPQGKNYNVCVFINRFPGLLTYILYVFLL